jgi:hypothetical protein
MLVTSASYGLPKSFLPDLDTDLAIANEQSHKSMIWILRTHGTLLVPLNSGIDPACVTYWRYSAHGQTVVMFLLSPSEGLLEKITMAKAEELIHKLPFDVSSLKSIDSTLIQWRNLVSEGLEKGYWNESGLSVDSSLPEWLALFVRSNNPVMVALLKKLMSRIGQSTGIAA